MIITKKDLICVLNELLPLKSIDVNYPPVGLLYTIQLEEECLVKPVSELSYDDQRKRFMKTKKVTEPLDSEVPNARDYRQCFYAAGLLEYESKAELEDKIKEAAKRTVLNRNRPLFIGYDTDALRHRLNRLVESIISKYAAESTMQIGFCISERVISQLSKQWSPKYKQHELPSQLNFSYNFLNQQPKDARMARLGSIEHNRTAKFTLYSEAKENRIFNDSDDSIIKSYQDFASDYAVDILLVTGDSDFAYKAETKRLNSHRMEYPDKIENFKEYHAEWDTVTELIFCTAIIFGYIEMSYIKILGVWAGKDLDDWDSDNLKIEISDPELEDKIKRHRSIIY
jgi:hypothetical protein